MRYRRASMIELSPSTVLLLVVCGLGWSGLDLLRKVLVAKVRPWALLLCLSAGALPFFGVWAAVEGQWAIRPGYWLPALASLVLNIVANLLFFEAVRVSPLSVTIPLLSLIPAFATLLAIPLVGQVPGGWQLAGIALVVVGALLLTARGGARSLLDPLRALRTERGSLMMIGVAVLWSATISLDKLAVDHASAAVHALALFGGLTVVTLLLMALRGQLGQLADLRRAPGAVVAAVALGSLALALQMIAFRFAPVGLIEVFKRGIGNSSAVVLGRVIFSEPITAFKVAGVALLICGVGLVLLA